MLPISHLRRGVISVLIFFVFIVGVSVLFFGRVSVQESAIAVLSPSPPPRRVVETSRFVTEGFEPSLEPFQQTDFYRVIIDNNLFRPLGWTPSRPTEPYRLIGTVLPRSTNTPPKAILETTAGKKTYIVTTGEKIDASTEVVSIQGKQVILSTDGQPRTLHLPSGF